MEEKKELVKEDNPQYLILFMDEQGQWVLSSLYEIKGKLPHDLLSSFCCMVCNIKVPRYTAGSPEIFIVKDKLTGGSCKIRELFCNPGAIVKFYPFIFLNFDFILSEFNSPTKEIIELLTLLVQR